MSRLEEVVRAFDAWRASRTNRKLPMPEALWSMAKELLPHYSRTAIRKALRVSGAQFKKRCLNETDEVSKNLNGFAVGYVESAQHASHEPCQLTLKGMRKSLTIQVNVAQLPYVLSVIEGYL